MQENFQKISNLRDRKDFVGFVLFMEASEYAFRLPSLSDAKENIKKRKRRLRDNPTSAVSKRR